MKRFLTVFFLGLSLVCARSEGNSPPTLFVAPLDGDLSQIQSWQPALGEGLAEMLITELTKLNKFQVLESTALEHLKGEIRLGDEGFVGQDEKVEKGGWSGADFMFRGKVTRFGSKTQGVNLGGFVPGNIGNLGIKQSKSDVRIDWRLVERSPEKIFLPNHGMEIDFGGFGKEYAVDLVAPPDPSASDAPPSAGVAKPVRPRG